MNVRVQEPVKLHYDNKVALQISANPIFKNKTYKIDCHFVREKIMNVLIYLEHISTKKKLADFHTRELGFPQHHVLLSKLGVLAVYTNSNLRGSIED